MIVNLLTYTDCRYFQHVACLLESIKEVANVEHTYRLIIIHSCKDVKILDRFSKSIDRSIENIQCMFMEMNRERFGKLKAKKAYLSDSIYDKMYIYEMLPKTLEKVLFVDSDVIFKKDPSILYQLDLGDFIIAAVRDEYLKFSQKARDTIALDSPDDYFNSGVMLVNLNKWKESGISEIAQDFAREKGHLTSLHDQDAFNFAIKGRWKQISSLWNPRPRNVVTLKNGSKVTLSKFEVYKKDIAYFVHFSGLDKPWTFYSNHPQKEEYFKYLRKTGFSDFQFQDVNFKVFVKKIWQILKTNFKYWKNYKRIDTAMIIHE